MHGEGHEMRVELETWNGVGVGLEMHAWGGT